LNRIGQMPRSSSALQSLTVAQPSCKLLAVPGAVGVTFAFIVLYVTERREQCD
jgi:hypothetical protein